MLMNKSNISLWSNEYAPWQASLAMTLFIVIGKSGGKTLSDKDNPSATSNSNCLIFFINLRKFWSLFPLVIFLTKQTGTASTIHVEWSIIDLMLMPTRANTGLFCSMIFNKLLSISFIIKPGFRFTEKYLYESLSR